jgi:carbamoyl-phosphate synthase small subunit
MRVGIFSGLNLSREEMVIEVRKQPQMSGSYLSEDVSTKQTYVVPARGQKSSQLPLLIWE